MSDPHPPHDHAGHDHGPAGHDHAGHGHDHAGHDHDHHDHGAPPPRPAARGWGRYAVAAAVVAVALLAATFDVVRQGSAVVITRFGDPVRVQVLPGPAWRLPAPIERTVEVDLRTHTTTTGLHDVGTRDGLRVVMQAYVAWRVPGDGQRVTQFLRAVRNRPDEAASQLRTFLGSSLETVAARFALADLLNTDAAKVRLGEVEEALKARLAAQLLDAYGIEVVQVGLARLMLPESTAAATITRMIAERQTAAEEKKAYGSKLAAEITSEAQKDARIIKAKAEEEASSIEAAARTESAAIYGKVQAADPELYAFLRGLDSLDQIINAGTRLVLRSDAAPFRALVEGPSPSPSLSPAPAPDPGHRTPDAKDAH
jgi:membrane protease subunit HflC